MNISDSGNPRLDKDGNDWVLVLTRTLKHSINEVWTALTAAEQLPAWGPFKTDRDLTTVGTVRLEHIDMPEENIMQGAVLEVNAPQLLVFRWGDDILRWELSDDGEHTVLVLYHRFADHKQAPSYAAGWHLCLDGLIGLLGGKKMPSMAGHNAYNYGYNELYAQYAKQLGIELDSQGGNNS
ncbi:SRPBCC domain-containing protein [Paenibacillus jiagnxiensis]|uniref:SRPBCC domain-containing protein n=1 Tax=Paenibacillus jiagnxiensis TaxID=3228926 RepID=UPI0033B7FAE8